MWRFVVVASSLFLVGSAPAADDVECTPCGDECEALGVAVGDRICSASPPASLPYYGVDVRGLPAPTGEFFSGDAPTWHVVDDTDPPRAEFDDEATTVIQHHDGDVRYTPRQRRDDVHVTPRQRTVDPPPHRHDPTIRRPAPRQDVHLDRLVLRPQVDDVALDPVPASTDDEDTVIRIHGDEAAINGEPVDADEIAVDDVDIDPLDDIDIDDDDIDDEDIDDEPALTTGYVEWKFIPVIEVLEATGGVTPVDAQRMLERDIDTIEDCFEPERYDADGALEVELHLAHTGRPQAVNGSTDGIRPTQARCILQRAWGYEFPRPAERADDPSQVRYRVEFVGQTVDAPTVDPERHQFLLERLAISDHPELEDAAAQSLMRHLDATESCAVQSIEALPEEFTVTEVQGRWARTEGHHYRPTDLDITVSNETSSELPPPRVVECYRRALTDWDFDVTDADVDARDLPDTLMGSFFVTLRPAGT